MIEITRYDGGLSITGHANYAEPGKDIVCAGVSVLAQTLIASIEELTTDEIKYSMQPGTVCIKHGKLSERAQVLVASFFVGVEAIAATYPDNVRIDQALKS